MNLAVRKEMKNICHFENIRNICLSEIEAETLKLRNQANLLGQKK